MNWQDFVSVLDVAPEPSDSVLLSRIREWRNAELAVTDYTQLPDAPGTGDNKWSWALYRQELRDMLNQGTPVKEIVFPVRPA